MLKESGFYFGNIRELRGYQTIDIPTGYQNTYIWSK